MIVIQDYLKCTKMKIKKVDIHAFRLFEDENVDFQPKRIAENLQISLLFMHLMDLEKQVSSIQWNSV